MIESEKQLIAFRDEMHLMRNIKPHPNIIQVFVYLLPFSLPQVLGVCTLQDTPLCIVTEFCVHGSLYSLLKDLSFDVPSEKVYKWVCGIVAGMYHLSREGIVHRDL